MAAAKTQRELAKACGKSQPAIAKWLKHPKWPFSRTGPWDVAQVKAWCAKSLGLPQPTAAATRARPAEAVPTAPADLDPRLKTDLFLKSVRARKLDFELRELQGQYVLRSEIEQDRVARIHAVKAALERLAVSLPPKLEGMKAAQMSAVIDGEVTAILHAFSRDPET